jgi:hypothetical protein
VSDDTQSTDSSIRRSGMPRVAAVVGVSSGWSGVDSVAGAKRDTLGVRRPGGGVAEENESFN